MALALARGRRGRMRSTATDASPLPIPGTIDQTVGRIDDAGGRAIAVPTNLASEAETERMVVTTVQQLGPVDILVNNAAITFPGDLDLELKRHDQIFAINLALRSSPLARSSPR